MSTNHSIGRHLAIIGTGPSAIFLLQRILDRQDEFRREYSRLTLFEKAPLSGMGMPYSPVTTDVYNLSNISPEEIPRLPQSFDGWLKSQDAATLGELGVGATEIRVDGIYPRLALGAYLRSQYRVLLGFLAEKDYDIEERVGTKVVDIQPARENDGWRLVVEEEKEKFHCDAVVIATGHYWNGDDHPDDGYYASPWPIGKLLPDNGKHHDFEIGTLGASLSAFDVVSSLAHRHGDFEVLDGVLNYRPHPGTAGFKIAMHSVQGLLPHLQFEQVHPMREIYRHATRKEMAALIGEDGLLRLAPFFEKICKPVLMRALRKDGLDEVADGLGQQAYGIGDFAATMTAMHDYRDAFEGMKFELAEAEVAAENKRPTYWKEALDDLMYLLNFHAHLLPAEDHLLLRSDIWPFVMNVVAALPLKSARMILALHDAGKLRVVPGKAEVLHDSGESGSTVVAVDDDGRLSKQSYRMFIDCSGQKPLEVGEFPFPTLVEKGLVVDYAAPVADEDSFAEKIPPELRRDLVGRGGKSFFKTGGISVDEHYRVTDGRSQAAASLFDMAFPHVTGVRPYSYGIQACDETARILVNGILG